ncbi:MAG: 4-hydroxy-3-methylbut-2-enyl diphosphate reductase, partial [Oscillospiraceae bacterium]|nr:4-hydroxy-3-methylbut-2-enyl diphosphate reductase [Oscillospiraceae bacterium]
MREIVEARHMGFCKGVGRAVKLTLQAASEHGACYTLGPVIHNRMVVEELERAGARMVSGLEEIPPGGTVVIRSHGVPPETYRRVSEMGLRLCDATCPDVARVHEIAAAESSSEPPRMVVILGDAGHPEVAAHAGWCAKPLVVKDLAALAALWDGGLPRADTPVSFVAQTTSRREDYDACVNFLKKQCTNLKIFDTICDATLFRQRDAENLALRCDAVLVVGDPESANTRRLADVCRRHCGMVFLVENAEQADKLPIPRDARVGLTAGASTPAGVIKEVKQTMENNIYPDAEQSFEEMLEKSFKTLTTGDKVTGVITSVTPTEIHVDLGTKHAGYIPVAELSDDPEYKAEEHLRVGETIETFVMRVNDVEGTA